MWDVFPESYINQEELERLQHNTNNSKNKLEQKGTNQKPHLGKQPREVTQTGQSLSWETAASDGKTFPSTLKIFWPFYLRILPWTIVVRLHIAYLTLSRHQVKQLLP